MARSHKKIHKKSRRKDKQLESVFKLIFNYMLYADTSNDARRERELHIERLKELQPLAAVCHSWRQAMLPIFYQSAVCSIKGAPRISSKTAGSYGSMIRDAKLAPNYTYQSNIELIIAGNNEQYVRRLTIDMFGDVAPDVPVAVFAQTGFSNCKWYGIEKLRISHFHGRAVRNAAYCSESLTKLNSYLLHALPSLLSIKYQSPDDRHYYREFPLDGLLASTLCRIKEVKLVSGLIPDMGSSAFMPGLVSLTLHCPILTDAAHLPMVFSETLETLRMGFSSANSIWDRFYNSGNKRLSFKRLKSLILEYVEPADAKIKTASGPKPVSLYDDCYFVSSESNSIYGGDLTATSDSAFTFDSSLENTDDEETLLDSQSPTRQRFYKQMERQACKQWPLFPKLQSLGISKFPDAIVSILRHFAIDQIPSISVRDVGRGWTCLNPILVSKLTSLRIHIMSQGFASKGDEYRYQAWINRLFSVSSHMSSLQLDAPTTLPVSLPDVIGMTRLTYLSFSFRIDLGTIPNLLSRLPFLQQLAMHVHPQSSWSHRHFGLLECGDYEILAHIPPLSCSLRTLIAYVGLDMSVDDQDGINYTAEDPMAVEHELAWLLARVPSLQLFKTEDWTSHAVRKCIDDLLLHDSIVPFVQHLVDVDIVVWKY
ncbi:hypothetical protein IWW42_001532 [Coemansia sp. RSA 1085]|nr:hypothetical protein IWW42_001532 [Coemansia sp. RSA 1085]